MFSDSEMLARWAEEIGTNLFTKQAYSTHNLRSVDAGSGWNVMIDYNTNHIFHWLIGCYANYS